jgi:PAS domain S-box-containing protein
MAVSLSNPLSADADAAADALAWLASALPVVEVDLAQGRLRRANEAAAGLTGQPAAALAGWPLQSLWPEGGAAPGATLRDRLAQAAGGPIELSLRRADGSAWWGECRRLDRPRPEDDVATLLLADVSARRREKQDLQQAAERHRQAALAGKAAAWEIYPSLGRIEMPDQLEELFGYPRGSLGNQLANWAGTVPPGEQPERRAALQAILEGRSSAYDLVHASVRGDGSVGWFHSRGVRVQGDPGEPVRVIGATVDITAQRHVERDLELARFAIENSPNAIMWIDGQGRVVRANRTASRSLGLSPEQLIGRRIWDFDVDVAPADWPGMLGRLQEVKTLVFKSHQRRSDGHVFPVEVAATVVPFEGKGYGFCIVRDISERVAAEQALQQLNASLTQRVDERTRALAHESERNRAILGLTIDGFVVIDEDTRVTECNDAFCHLLGYSREELVGMPVQQFDANPDQTFVAARRDEIKRTGHGRFDTCHRRKDGRVLDVEVSANAQPVAGGMLIYCFVRDITPRREAADALRRARDEAEQANRAKSEFLSRMSHELRTPLNAVLGFGQLLQLSVERSDQKGQLLEIMKAGQHLLTLIDEVLDLARVEAGRLSISPEPVALLPLLAECLTLVGPQARAAGITLHDVPASCDVPVQADRTRLKQVLLNLLSNAIKYNRPAGGVRVLCRVREDGPASATVRLGIRDDGEGLDESQQARLFRPFERLDADHRHIEGTGIGLALSQRLAQLMGGRIEIESAPGQGSCFWVSLPRSDHPDDTANAPVAPVAEDLGQPGERCEVLCIEDNPANLRLLEGLFARRTDLRLISAMAPGLGLELARSRRPALILLDINLPDMDGYAVMRCLQESELTRRIPVVAISANAMPQDIARGRAAGFDAYLSKPLNLALLMQQVDDLLATRAVAPRSANGQA